MSPFIIALITFLVVVNFGMLAMAIAYLRVIQYICNDTREKLRQATKGDQ